MYSMMSMLIAGLIVFGGIKIGSILSKKQNMTKIDFSVEKVYFREILKKYSPEVLSYIDDFAVDKTRDIIAVILNLKLKKKIAIEDDKIIVLNDDVAGLSQLETYVISRVDKDFGRVIINREIDIEKMVREDALKRELITTVKKKDLKEKEEFIKNALYIFVGIMVVIAAVFEGALRNSLCLLFPFFPGTMTFNDVIIGIFMLLPIIFIYLYVGYKFFNKGKYKRTDLGEEINYKIEGLKKYIKDYSLLDEKEREMLEIWDEYLIYSLIFKQNNTIKNDMEKFVVFID